MTEKIDLANSALETSDSRTRSARAGRLVWLAQFQVSPPAIIGRHESLSLLEETRVCYINGLFIATILTATAFIEQTLIEELEYCNDKKPRHTFALAIIAAKAAELLPDNLLNKADALSKIRNSFAHKKPDNHASRLPVRVQENSLHPQSILEADAKLAVETMYAIFHSTLKGI